MKTILLLAFALAIALFTPPFAGGSLAQRPAEPTLDQLKAREFTVTTLDGDRVGLNTLLGEGKPVLLDFWATWCGPCRVEIPHLNELHKKYGKDGLIVIGLNLEDPIKDRRAVKAFMKRYKMDYQTVFAQHEIYQFFNVGSAGARIPQTVVFGPDGTLIKRMVGYSPLMGRDILSRAVEKAMAGAQEGRAGQ